MATAYTKEVISTFTKHANPDRAASMSKYMKNQFQYYGIDAPTRKEIGKPFLAKSMLPDLKEAPSIVRELWQAPERELQYFALEYLQKYERKAPEQWIDLYEELILDKSWWDTVDGLAASQVGSHFKRFDGLIKEYTAKWMNSGNFWLQRTCLLFQLKYREHTDFPLLISFIKPLVDENEFFIRKAIGWSLRQYGKTAPDEVRQFVATQPMSNLSRKEALKLL